jgi:periplasmic copper chaperone A
MSAAAKGVGRAASSAWTALALAMCTCAYAQHAGIRVDGAWARRAPMLDGSGNGAVYVTLVNAGREADALISAASNVAGAVEIHETYQQSGMMRMRPLDRIDVAPGAIVEMKPGGRHIMLLNLKRDLKSGETTELTLVFRRAGAIAVKAEIR